MIRNKVFGFMLVLLAFLSFFPSCSGNSNVPGGPESGNADQQDDFTPENISSDDMKKAIRTVTEAFERNEGSGIVLTSFVIEGQSLDGNRAFESSMLFKFDGNNSFYRKDVWQGQTMQSWETYDESNPAAHWTVIDSNGTRTDSRSSMYDQISYISLSDAQIEAAVPDENHYYNFDVGSKRVKLGFNGQKLRYIDMREESLGFAYEYELYVKDYGETVVIPRRN